MEPLNERSRALLEAYRQSISPDAQDARDTWELIAERAELQSDEVADGRSHASPGRVLPWLIAAAATAAAIVVGIGQPGAAREVAAEPLFFQSIQNEDPGEQTDQVSERTPAPTRAARPLVRADLPRDIAEPQPLDGVTDEATHDASAKTDTPELPPRRPSRDPADAGDEAPAATDEPAPADPLASVRLEAEILRRARSALAAGNARSALRLCESHGEQFPDAAMDEEIAVVRLQALCALDQRQAWEAAYASFKQAHPGSPLAVHLRLDCFE